MMELSLQKPLVATGLNTTRKELQPLELTNKVSTEFAHNGISRGLHKERYCGIDIISELKRM